MAINSISPERIKRRLKMTQTRGQKAAAEDSFRRMWYNELAYAHPPLLEPLLLDRGGVSANIKDSASRFTFPSWRISSAYYCVYHATRALCDSLGVKYRREEHGSPLRSFKATKLEPALQTFLGFPFNIRHKGGIPSQGRLSDLMPASRPHLRFKYAAHPRPPHDTFDAILRKVKSEFSRRWRRRPSGAQRQAYMLPDLLHEFRNWVNYVDVKNMLALKSGGYRAYLDQDLLTIVWFYGAMSELVGIAALGAKRFCDVADSFWGTFVVNDEALWRRNYLWPLDARMRIYLHLGFLQGGAWNPRYPSSPGALLELCETLEHGGQSPGLIGTG